MKAILPLLLFMAGIQGWVLTVPLFGPLLFPLAAQSGGDPVQSASLFMNFYASSFLLWGILLHRIKPDWGRMASFMFISVSVCFVLSISLLWVHSSHWIFIFPAIGLFASLPSIGWLYFLKRLIPRTQIGFVFGINGALVSGFHFLIKASNIPLLSGLLLASGMLVLALITIPWIRKLQPTEEAPVKTEIRSQPLPLFLFIFVIFLLGGIMYQVVNPFLSGFPFITNYFEKLTYLLVMPFVGRLIDRQGFRSVVYGMTFLGLAYTSFAFSTSFPMAFLGSALIQIGFAFLDIFVLYALSTWSSHLRPFLFIGSGLCIYIFSIRVGLMLNGIIVPVAVDNYNVAYLVARCILLLSFLLIHWLGDKEPQEMEKQRLFNELSAYHSEKDEELKLAAKIQQDMLPSKQQLPEGVEATAILTPAKEVAGDFYDIIVLDDNRTIFVVGDVTDKGLPAALIMSTVVGLIRSEAYHQYPLTDIIKQLNRVLYKDQSSDIFVTLGLALVDTAANTLTYASAGHVSPYLVKELRVSTIPSSSFPIGVDSDMEPFTVIVPFSPGDSLVLYTDGIIEAQNAKQQLYGFERLESVLSKAASLKLSPNEMKLLVLSDVNLFVENDSFKDDITLLIVKRNG